MPTMEEFTAYWKPLNSNCQGGTKFFKSGAWLDTGSQCVLSFFCRYIFFLLVEGNIYSKPMETWSVFYVFDKHLQESLYLFQSM